MVFRSENEALRARITHLERELAESRREIEMLRVSGRAPDSTAFESGRNRFLGSTTQLAFEHVIARELEDEDLEGVVRSLRRAFGVAGQIEYAGRSLVWRPTRAEKKRCDVVATIDRGDGDTRIHVREHLGGRGRRLLVRAIALTLALVVPLMFALGAEAGAIYWVSILAALGAVLGAGAAFSASTSGRESRLRELWSELHFNLVPTAQGVRIEARNGAHDADPFEADVNPFDLELDELDVK
ncbi:MAG: hypothetical protein AAF411_09080 [Myxococcota bacterium]